MKILIFLSLLIFVESSLAAAKYLSWQRAIINTSFIGIFYILFQIWEKI